MSLNRNISYFSNGSMLQAMCFLLQKIFVIDFKVTIMGSQNTFFFFSFRKVVSVAIPNSSNYGNYFAVVFLSDYDCES